MIHRAIFGSFERMIAILTEQTKGKWPFWLSPRQVLVVNVSPNSIKYAHKVHQQIFSNNIDSETDLTDHTLAKKVNINISKGQKRLGSLIQLCGCCWG